MTTYSIIAVAYLFYSVPQMYESARAILRREVSILNVLNCVKCLSFWITLVFTQSVVTAALVSLAVLLLDSFIVTRL